MLLQTIFHSKSEGVPGCGGSCTKITPKWDIQKTHEQKYLWAKIGGDLFTFLIVAITAEHSAPVEGANEILLFLQTSATAMFFQCSISILRGAGQRPEIFKTRSPIDCNCAATSFAVKILCQKTPK
jgi:hypothetical protein